MLKSRLFVPLLSACDTMVGTCRVQPFWHVDTLFLVL